MTRNPSYSSECLCRPLSQPLLLTVKGLIVDRVRHYEFKVDEKTYVTEKCIAEYASETIIGRGTRIYLVVDKQTKAKCVLKEKFLGKIETWNFAEEVC